VGFWPPVLHRLGAECPDCFHDVTEGTNACTEYACCDDTRLGYLAGSGWDPVTGWGTLNASAIASYLLAE
jgi:hypothetical protein